MVEVLLDAARRCQHLAEQLKQRNYQGLVASAVHETENDVSYYQKNVSKDVDAIHARAVASSEQGKAELQGRVWLTHHPLASEIGWSKTGDSDARITVSLKRGPDLDSVVFDASRMKAALAQAGFFVSSMRRFDEDVPDAFSFRIKKGGTHVGSFIYHGTGAAKEDFTVYTLVAEKEAHAEALIRAMFSNPALNRSHPNSLNP